MDLKKIIKRQKKELLLLSILLFFLIFILIPYISSIILLLINPAAILGELLSGFLLNDISFLAGMNLTFILVYLLVLSLFLFIFRNLVATFHKLSRYFFQWKSLSLNEDELAKASRFLEDLPISTSTFKKKSLFEDKKIIDLLFLLDIIDINKNTLYKPFLGDDI